ncbi:MAG: hypothetical protein Q9222_003698 [Ikaeria aurantiellina]
MSNAGFETNVDRLLAAPAIVQDVKPMVWMYIDAPGHGTTMLVWQPLAKLGIEFASDGYIWADAEQAFSSEIKGYTLEIRYRLMPSPNPAGNPNVQPCDPSLWIVHYSPAEPAHHIPTNRIPMNSYVQSTLTTRNFLQQHGQLVRKEFMLHDRNSWPTINVPGTKAGAQAGTYPSNVISHLHRQQQGYAQAPAAATNQAGIGPPPAKRARPNIPNAAGAEATGLQAADNRDFLVEDDEDVSRGDLLDFLTPREISAMRYKQHHEWLGEVFRSPYDTQQIVPGELGLGRKGELEALTRDFFNAPTEPATRSANGTHPARVGRMEPEKASEFTKMATDRITEINAEIEKMKKQHAKRMAKLAKGAELREAEKALRTLAFNHNEGQADGAPDRNSEHDERITIIQGKVEALLGKNIHRVVETECIQKGGLMDKLDESEDADQDYDFSEHAADLSGQIPTFQTPQDPISSMEGTPGLNTEQAPAAINIPDVVKSDEGPEVTGMPVSNVQDASQTKDGEAEDWIMVNKEGDDAQDDDALDTASPDLNTFTNDPAMDTNMETSGDNGEGTAGELPDFAATAEGELDADFAANDFTEGVDFANLDTAGEALSGYEAEESMGMDDGADLGLDDTAFGDAFVHSNETGSRQDDDLGGS